jgi:Ca2+/Na+ antiporter
MWSDIVMMWHHHPIMLIILVVLCIVLVRLLVQRLFQWVLILVLVIAVYSIFMYSTGKRTKQQLWQEGKAKAEHVLSTGKKTLEGKSDQNGNEPENKPHHSPKSGD